MSDLAARHDLTGKVAVVTGASGGLGLETARALAVHGADVVLAARNEGKLAAAAETLAESGVRGNVFTATVDLADLASVRSAAAAIAEANPSIDLLVNNAGVMACPLARTADGFEMQLGTNHFGHFAFTLGLLDALRAGAPSRVVALSSGGHHVCGMQWDDPNFETSEYHNFLAYGQAKTANALFAVELDRRFAPEGVHAFSVHPGVIATDLGRHLTEVDIKWMMDRIKKRSGGGDPSRGDGEGSGGGGFRYKSIPQGAATTVWAATAPELDDHGGAYLEDCHVARRSEGPEDSAGVQDWASDPDEARRLWDLSLDLTAN